jgi:hypothetical protein
VTTTTIRSAIDVHHARASRVQTRRHGLGGEIIVLTGLAATAAVVGAAAPALCAAVLVVAATGSGTAAGAVMALALPFLAITIPTMAIWLLGAVGTRQTIRRMAGG